MKKIIKKIFLIIIMFLIFNFEYCYANENYINADIKLVDDSNVELNISVNDKTNIWGFLGNIVYDQNKLKFIKCTSKTHDVSYKNNMLLLEKTKGYKNTNISTCSFSVINSNDVEINIVDVTLSDGKKLLYNEDINLKLEINSEETDEENKEESNQEDKDNINKDDDIVPPPTFGKRIIVIIVLLVVTLLSGILINKKYKIFSYLLFLGLLVYPMCINAKISESMIEEIRGILLKEKSDNTDNKYDYDNDNKLSINDLILALIDYNNPSEEEEEEVKDTTAPVIKSCVTIIKDNKTTITINTDDKDIAKYVVNDDSTLSFTEKEFIVNKALTNVKITAYDTSGNKTNVNCVDKTPVSSTNEPIKPNGNEKIKYQEDKETIKVWIELVSRSGRTDYYTTHIWVKDAYNQFKLQVPDNFGNELVNSTTLLKNAIEQQNLSDKVVVSVNASGFVKNGTWWQDYYNANSKFDMTSISPIVLVNGVKLRDISNETLPYNVNRVYGLTKDSKLTYYSYYGADKQKENPDANKAVSNKIISDGVKNTFAFKPILVENGKVVSTDATPNIRQGICQIDKNNFIFVTDVYSDSRDGFSFKELGEYMVSLGCQTGFNLDGGGSTSLTYKSSSRTQQSLVYSSRRIADIIYFHE